MKRPLMRPFVYGEIFMFRSQEDSPYGVLPKTTIFTEITEHFLIPEDKNGVNVTQEKLPTISRNIFILRKPTHKIEPTNSDVVNESFDDLDLSGKTFIDLDLLKHSRRPTEETPVTKTEPSFVDESPPENIIKIKERDIKSFKKTLDRITREVKNLFVDNYLPNLMGIEHASAYTEAFVRDGLGIEGFTINSDMLPYIKNGIKIDFVAQIIKTLPNIPDEIKVKYLEGLAVDALATSKSQVRDALSKEYAENQRYNSSLDNPVGQIRHSTSVGAIRSRKRLNEEKADAKGKDRF